MPRQLRPHCTKPIRRHNDTRQSNLPSRPPLYTGRYLPRLIEAEEAPKRFGAVHDAQVYVRPDEWEDF
jgi:hypothetical protein